VTPPLLRRAAAELLGTYALVTAGCGAIVVDSFSHALGHAGVAASFGLVVLVAVATTGHLSGAHLNPAVTVAFAAFRHFPWTEVPAYVAGQLAGAAAAAATLAGLLGPQAGLGATVPAGSAAQSLGMEMLLTAVLMFVITAVATDSRAVGELAACRQQLTRSDRMLVSPVLKPESSASWRLPFRIPSWGRRRRHRSRKGVRCAGSPSPRVVAAVPVTRLTHQ